VRVWNIRYHSGQPWVSKEVFDLLLVTCLINPLAIPGQSHGRLLCPS